MADALIQKYQQKQALQAQLDALGSDLDNNVPGALQKAATLQAQINQTQKFIDAATGKTANQMIAGLQAQANSSTTNNSINPQIVDSGRKKSGDINPTAQSQTQTGDQVVVNYSETKAQSAFEGGQNDSDTNDPRVRLRAMSGQEAVVYGDPNNPSNIMSILHETKGVLFPYTPVMQFAGSVNYGSMAFTHTNQDFAFYTKTETTEFAINGSFTARTTREARYLLAVIHFLRANTKMRFGQQDTNAGLPPPVFLLDGYGTFMMNSLPVLIKNWSIDMPDNVDYVRVDVGNPDSDYMLTRNPTISRNASQSLVTGSAMVPVKTTINVTLMLQNIPARWRQEFNLNDFRSGKLLNNKGWF